MHNNSGQVSQMSSSLSISCLLIVIECGNASRAKHTQRKKRFSKDFLSKEKQIVKKREQFSVRLYVGFDEGSEPVGFIRSVPEECLLA